MLSAVHVAEHGGETEFASNYGAYDELSDEEKRRFASLRVVKTGMRLRSLRSRLWM